MIAVKRAGERGRVVLEGGERWRTFDDGDPSDPLRAGFRTLESLDEESLAPGAGVPQECATDAELLTYVWKGALIREPAGDDAGTVLETGEWGHAHVRGGTARRIVNGSRVDGVRVFHCRFTPDRTRVRTPDAGKRFPLAERTGVLRLVLSPDGRDGSLRSRRDARVYSSVLEAGRHVVHELAKRRGAWVHVVHGSVRLGDEPLGEGDGASYVDEPAVSLTSREPSEILLFDLA